MLLVYKKKPVGAYLLAKPSGMVTGLGDAQAAMADAQQEAAAAAASQEAAASVPAEAAAQLQEAQESTAPYIDLPLDANGYPVE